MLSPAKVINFHLESKDTAEMDTLPKELLALIYGHLDTKVKALCMIVCVLRLLHACARIQTAC